MTFFKTALASGIALSVLAACGGSGTESAPEETKPVENPVVTPEPETETEAPAETAETATETAEAPAPEVAPAAAPEADLASEFANLPEPYKSADYARGRRTFKLCQSCHTLAEGGGNLVGPNLYGIFGRDVGAVSDFTYSRAVQEADFVWTPEVLEQWLENPRGFLPGNKMSFAGVRRPDDRHAVIAYIMVETGYEAAQ